MRVLRSVVALLVAFVLLAPAMYLVVLVMAPFDRKRTAVNSFSRLWTGAWKWILGIKVRVLGKENLVDDGPFIVVANHNSYLDFLVLYHDFPKQLRFLAKKTLIWVPVFGIAFYTLDHVYISRKNKAGHRKSLAALAAKIAEGKSIFIFPQGRRAPAGSLGEWKKGAFVMATELHVPLLPVAIEGSAALHGIGDLFPRPGTITIRIGKPISTKNTSYDDRDRLLATTREAVAKMLEQDKNG